MSLVQLGSIVAIRFFPAYDSGIYTSSDYLDLLSIYLYDFRGIVRSIDDVFGCSLVSFTFPTYLFKGEGKGYAYDGLRYLWIDSKYLIQVSEPFDLNSLPCPLGLDVI